MGDIRATFKGLVLGDFITGPPEKQVIITPNRFAETIWGSSAVHVVAGPSARHRIALRCNVRKLAAETSRQFFGRKLQFLKDLRSVAGFGTTYSTLGPLVFFEDDATDITVTASSPPAGTNVDCLLASTIGLAVGDYFFIRSSNTVYDLTTVVAVSGTTATLANISNVHSNGVLCGRVWFYYPNVSLQDISALEGNIPAAHLIAREITMSFEGVSDPVSNLV